MAELFWKPEFWTPKSGAPRFHPSPASSPVPMLPQPLSITTSTFSVFLFSLSFEAEFHQPTLGERQGIPLGEKRGAGVGQGAGAETRLLTEAPRDLQKAIGTAVRAHGGPWSWSVHSLSTQTQQPWWR